MRIGRMHGWLAELSGTFSVDVLMRHDTGTKIRDALTRHERLDQRHSPLRPILVCWLILCLSLFRAKSIPNVLAVLMSALRGRRPGLALKPVTDGAIAHARERLGAAPMKSLFESLAEEVRPEPSFHGLRVWAMDGVHMTMPDTPPNAAHFGRPTASRGQSAWPQLQMIALTDVVSHRLRGAYVGPCETGERDMGRPLLEYIGPGDLLLIDRGFYSAPMLYDIGRRGSHFLARLPSTVKPRVIQKLGRGDCLVEITGRRPLHPGEAYTPSRGRPARTRPFRLIVRMITYRVKGEESPVRLVTSLLDPQQVPAMDLALGYHERWESELGFDEVKTHFSTVQHGTPHTVFRSKTPALVEQEFWAMLATYNLVRGLMNDAAREHGIPAREISFVDSLNVIHVALDEVQKAPNHRLPHLHRRLLRDIAACRLDRPRRPRVYDRVVKVKMSNYRLKREHHRQKFRNLEKDLHLVAA